MAAEIAILNKGGIALAADNAASIKKRKTIHSVNKLFSLSKRHSVGMMIYGSANFMGVPMETIIKSYRTQLGDRPLQNIERYGESFMDYLSGDKRYDDERLEERVVSRTFNKFFKMIVNDLSVSLKQAPKNQNSTNLVFEYLDMIIDEYKEQEKSIERLLDISYFDYFNRFADVLIEIITKHLKNFLPQEVSLPQNIMDKLLELSFGPITSEFFSPKSTGLVIAGFGEDDILPSLIEYQIEGFICGKLKYSIHSSHQISYIKSRNEMTSDIVTFGQNEMVQSFIYGISPDMEAFMFHQFKKMISNFPINLQQKLGVTFNEEQNNVISKIQEQIFHETLKKYNYYQKQNFALPILDIASFLPKEELAEMAETLINLTAFKQKISSNSKAVGGPIDVAVISKGDGFVWINRKEYFKPELNNHFFES